MGFKSKGPMKLYCDKLTINIAYNPIQNDRTKHIDLKRKIEERVGVYVLCCIQNIN